MIKINIPTVDEIKAVFSSNLRRLMVEHDKTQSDLVRDLKLKQSTISDWLSGRNYPRMDKVELLARYFNVHIGELILEDFAPEPVQLPDDAVKCLQLYSRLEPLEKAKALVYLDKLYQDAK